MILSVGDKVRFKYDFFPAKENQEGTVTEIDQVKKSYTIEIIWEEKQKISKIVLHETGLHRYLK